MQSARQFSFVCYRALWVREASFLHIRPVSADLSSVSLADVPQKYLYASRNSLKPYVPYAEI
jgi:hypothetical protein